MFSKHKRHVAVAAILAASLSLSSQSAHAVPIVGTVAAGVVADNIIGEINKTIDDAMAKGDYLLARAGMQAKDAIDAWKIANSALLDQAFDRLDQSQRQLFTNANALIEKANTDVAARMETAQRIIEMSNNIIENIPVIGSNATFVTRYGPRINPGADEIILTIRGVNLDRSDPALAVSGNKAKRTSLTQNEAQFEIPDKDAANDTDKLRRLALSLSYTVPGSHWYSKLIGGKNVVNRELSVIVLPKSFAKYHYAPRVTRTTKATKPFTAELGQFKGRNTRIYKIANPPTGWKWDLSQPYSFQQGSGEAGRCEGFDKNSTTENGISAFARVDEIKDSSNFFGVVKKDGYVSCNVLGTIYQMNSETVNGPTQDGKLSWGNPVILKKPEGTVSQILTVTLFNGEQETEVGNGQGKFFQTTDNRETLILSPVFPTALAE